MIGHVGGRQRSTHRVGALCLRHYLSSAIDASPMARHYSIGTALAMWGNDRAGCCGIAALYGRRQILAKLTGEPFVAVDPDSCFADYRKVNTRWDGVPGSETDRGVQMIDVLNLAKEQPLVGETIEGFAYVNVRSRWEMEVALNLFGPLYVGGELPKAIDKDPTIWDMPASPGPDDVPDPTRGHAFLLGGFDHTGWDVATYGRSDYWATNAWVGACVDEAYVIFDRALVRDERPAPNGFDITRLRRDLGLL